jgi:hypothetical protein
MYAEEKKPLRASLGLHFHMSAGPIFIGCLEVLGKITTQNALQDEEAKTKSLLVVC